MRLTELKLPLDHSEPELRSAIVKRLGIAPGDLAGYTIFRRSHDARKPSAIVFTYTLDLELKDEKSVLARLRGDRNVQPTPDTSYRFVARAPTPAPAPRPVVIGTGPCGLFAGLLLAQMGFRPLILERGKAVRERTQDTWGLWRKGKLDPESNVQFGEGGAGTFSDGKLYSQIKDPAPSRPQGADGVRQGRRTGGNPLRRQAPHRHLQAGVHGREHARRDRVAGRRNPLRQPRRGCRDRNGQVRAVLLADGTRIAASHVVLAVGHSARDTFRMLQQRGVHIEAKPFSIGVRIEHPQSLIDRARLGRNAGNPLLGAADYKLVHHCDNGRSAYSFCMCPGGTVVAATSEPGRVVTNGMSQYSRNERNANSALVVGVTPADYPGSDTDPLAGIAFQRHWESLAFEAGGGNYNAPAQRVGDFLAGRPSTTLGTVLPSYTPGVTPSDLTRCLPDYVVAALRESLPAFGREIAGFAMDDALLTGVETRTSSPIRITRGEDFQSLNTRGLFPAGEGAGYAGGILSAAVDGIKVAEAVALSLTGAAEAPETR
jgi:uncharacterized FAD-dependent dehydrogenase